MSRWNNHIVFRKAEAEDIELFLTLAGKSLITFRYFDKRPVSIINNHLVTLVAEDTSSSEIVGYGHLDPEGDKVWLGVAVAEGNEGKGIGGEVVRKLKEHAQYLQLSNIYLSVDEDNRSALVLYQKEGFQKVRGVVKE